MIVKLQALQSVDCKGDDAATEDGTAVGFFGAAFTHLKQTRVNRLLLKLVVNLFGALALEDDRGNSGGPIPGCEVGNRSVAGQSKNVVSFLNAAGVIGKHLAHEYLGVAIVDVDGDLHFFER